MYLQDPSVLHYLQYWIFFLLQIFVYLYDFDKNVVLENGSIRSHLYIDFCNNLLFPSSIL